MTVLSRLRESLLYFVDYLAYLKSFNFLKNQQCALYLVCLCINSGCFFTGCNSDLILCGTQSSNICQNATDFKPDFKLQAISQALEEGNRAAEREFSMKE